jgi:DNA polymerase III sliding clamp (beta) subunit (PCNA family)
MKFACGLMLVVGLEWSSAVMPGMSRSRTKRVELDFAMGGLTIRVGDKQDGDGEIFVEHSDWGTKASAAFNPDYLLDVLKSVGEDQIEAQVGGEGKPSIFRSGESFQHMIMALS